MEMTVVGPQFALILLVGLRGIVRGDDGKDEIGISPAVAIDDLLYAALDLHHDLLPRFVTLIDDQAVPYLFIPEKSHVNKRHTLGIETKKEYVARELQD